MTRFGQDPVRPDWFGQTGSARPDSARPVRPDQVRPDWFGQNRFGQIWGFQLALLRNGRKETRPDPPGLPKKKNALIKNKDALKK